MKTRSRLHRIVCAAFVGSMTAVAGIAPAQSSHGISKADMDVKSEPCRDFYAYADGGWLARNPVPPEFSRWGSFIVLADQNREVLRSILDEAAADE